MYLSQYNEKCQLVKTIPVAESLRSAGAMYIGGDKIFLAVHDHTTKYRVIGRFVSGKIMVPTIEQLQKGVEDTFWGTTKKYRISNFELRVGADVEVIDANKAVTTYLFKKILSIQFMGEDDRGAFYIKTELDDESGNLAVEVHRLERGYIKTVRMLPSKIDTWSIKKYDATWGVITQFLPEQDRLRLNFYKVNP
jgi:hypothetical protein